MIANTRPLGKGFYLRDFMTPREGIREADITLLKALGMRFAAVNVVHPITISRLQSEGIWPWVFGLPSQWGPDQWRATLARSHQVALATGAHRVWADPENGWPAASPREWLALGVALRELAKSGIQVCVTTHGGLRTRVAEYVAPLIAPFGGIVSPQLYDHSRDAALNYAAGQVAKWRDTMSGCAIVPSVGVLSSGPLGPGAYSDARYQGVFARYPREWSAAIVWPERRPTAFQQRVLSAWRVGHAIEV